MTLTRKKGKLVNVVSAERTNGERARKRGLQSRTTKQVRNSGEGRGEPDPREKKTRGENNIFRRGTTRPKEEEGGSRKPLTSPNEPAPLNLSPEPL